MPHTKKHKRITWIVVILIVLVFAGGGALHLFYAPPVTIEVSPDTTYITEPLKPDGLPDYAAAINDMLRPEGVTPETNGVVAMLRVLGPETIDAHLREAFFRELGLAEVPSDNPVPIDFGDFVETIDPDLMMAIPEDFDREEWNDEYEYGDGAVSGMGSPMGDPFALPGPGSKTPVEDGPAWDPEHDAWHLTKERVEEARRTGEKILPVGRYCRLLDQSSPYREGDFFERLPPEIQGDFQASQDELVRRLREAVDRPHWYLPVVGAGGELAYHQSLISKYRQVSKVLAARIRRQLRRGNHEEATDEIVLGYRLAHRVADEGFVIHYLVAQAMRSVVERTAFEIVKEGGFEADRLKELRQSLAQLPPLPGFRLHRRTRAVLVSTRFMHCRVLERGFACFNQ